MTKVYIMNSFYKQRFSSGAENWVVSVFQNETDALTTKADIELNRPDIDRCEISAHDLLTAPVLTPITKQHFQQ